MEVCYYESKKNFSSITYCSNDTGTGCLWRKFIRQRIFFKEFFEKEVPGNPLKAEYLIPIFIGELLEQGKMSVKVLKTNDTWYGMTYHEDVAAVKGSFKEMLENGVYKADLFSDL